MDFEKLGFQPNGDESWHSFHGTTYENIVPTLKRFAVEQNKSVIINRDPHKVVHGFYLRDLKTKPVGVYSHWEHPQFEVPKFEDRLTAL